MIVKMEYKIRIQCLIWLLCVGMSLFIACKDDVLYSGEYGSEGEPVTISLKWSVPEMDVRSRAEMSDADAAKVNDLWVGIYNVATGNVHIINYMKGFLLQMCILRICWRT